MTYHMGPGSSAGRLERSTVSSWKRHLGMYPQKGGGRGFDSLRKTRSGLHIKVEDIRCE